VRQSDAVETARRALGTKLAAYRRAAQLSQDELARLADYSRSTIANVETGRQHVPREFWALVDSAVHADGALIRANDEVETAARQEHVDAAQQAGPYLPALASPYSNSAQASATGDAWLDVIAAAAAEAGEQAQKAAVTEIGPGTVDQMTADVIRLGRAYVSAPPLPLFTSMRQTLGRIQGALQLKAYPSQARELNFLAGALCGLMANASLDLDREEAADDLARAAWTHGRIIDHGPLMGWARGTQALAAIWDHRFTDAIQHAENGLADVPSGMGAMRLHAIRARALARHGDHAEAQAAIAVAEKARTTGHRDDLHAGVAGEFAFDEAKLCYYQSLVVIDAEGPKAAGQAAGAAICLYQAAPFRVRSYGCEALARVQFARAQLMSHRVDTAAQALADVLVLDPQMRIGSLAQQLETCRQLLAGSAYRSSATARQLDRQIASFTSVSATPALQGR
jgi:DNA-binding XRE family transcriptional regulator